MSQNQESIRVGPWLRMTFCLFALASSGNVLVAQQQSDSRVSPAESQDVKPVVLQLPSESQNVALLGTDQRFVDLETLQTRRRTFFMYGMGLSESYEDFSAGTAGQNFSDIIWNPHVALINASNHSSFSVQYAPSIVQATSGSSGHQVFHAGDFSLGQPIAPNWALQLTSSETYGTDSARLLGPLAFQVNGGVPIVNSNSALFQLNRGKVFTTTNDLDLRWQRNPSQAVSFTVGENTLLPDGGPDNSTIFGQLSYSVAVTSRTGLNFGGNFYHRVFTQGNCDAYGFTVGISHQFTRYINIWLGGGPEFMSSPCTGGLGGNYVLSMSVPLSRVSRLGLMAERSYASSFLVNSQWTDTAAVSYSRQLSEAIGVTLNSGYARSVGALIGPGAYTAYFADADLSWRLSRTISVTTTYRRFEQVSGGPDQGQNVAMISLGWNPLPIRIVK